MLLVVDLHTGLYSNLRSTKTSGGSSSPRRELHPSALSLLELPGYALLPEPIRCCGISGPA